MNSTPAQPADSALLCPACGYDLRGSDSPRCPECGLEIDRTALQTSAIPWAHRKSIGRFRAYWRTIWQITLGSRKLAHEAAKPQDPRDGAAFVRVTGVLLSILLLAGAIVLARETSFWREPPVIHGISSSQVMFGGQAPPAWLLDLGIPWAAGVTVWPIPAICLVFLAFHCAGVARTVFRVPKEALQEQRDRAVALGSYVSAPLVLLIPAYVILSCGLYLARSELKEEFLFHAAMITMVWGGGLLIPSLLLCHVVRVAQWVKRTRHCGPGRALLATVELLALWLGGMIVFLGIIPWCLGFGWIVIDSLRR